MAMQNKRSMIDTRCKELQPGWGPKEHDGELQMLYDALNDDESIEALVGCVWGPENAFRPSASRWDRMMQYDGIAVVTGSRVVFLKRRGINKLTTEMPLHALKSVDVRRRGRSDPHRTELQRMAWRRQPRGLQDARRTGWQRPEIRRPGGGTPGRSAPTGHARLVCGINRGEHNAASGEPLCRYGQGGAGRCPVAGTLHHVGAD